MKTLAAALLVLVLATGCASAQTVTVTGPNRDTLVENRNYTITWEASGLASISAVAEGTRTPLGMEGRGEFAIPISDAVPAEHGQVTWTVPWIDSVRLTLKLKGYDASGAPVTSALRDYGFRPAVMAHRTRDGIYLDLHKPTDQRLYVQKGGRIVTAYLTSSSDDYRWLPSNVHPRTPHDHAGVFRVISKSPNHFSELYQAPMPWSMGYVGGHFIHATSPNLYEYLGGSASKGCNRLTAVDAKQLYDSTPIGTRVEVIGPEG